MSAYQVIHAFSTLLVASALFIASVTATPHTHAQAPQPGAPPVFFPREWRFINYDHSNSANLAAQQHPDTPTIPSPASHQLTLKWRARQTLENPASPYLHPDLPGPLFLSGFRLYLYSWTNQGLLWASPIIPQARRVLAIRPCRPSGDLLIAVLARTRMTNEVYFVRASDGNIILRFTLPQAQEARTILIADYDNDGYCEIYPSWSSDSFIRIYEFTPSSIQLVRSINLHSHIAPNVVLYGYPIKAELTPNQHYLVFIASQPGPLDVQYILALPANNLSAGNLGYYSITNFPSTFTGIARVRFGDHDRLAVLGKWTSTHRLYLVHFNGSTWSHNEIANVTLNATVVGRASFVVSQDMQNDNYDEILVHLKYGDDQFVQLYSYQPSLNTWTAIFPSAQATDPNDTSLCDLSSFQAELGDGHVAPTFFIRPHAPSPSPALLALCSPARRGLFALTSTPTLTLTPAITLPHDSDLAEIILPAVSNNNNTIIDRNDPAYPFVSPYILIKQTAITQTYLHLAQVISQTGNISLTSIITSIHASSPQETTFIAQPHYAAIIADQHVIYRSPTHTIITWTVPFRSYHRITGIDDAPLFVARAPYNRAISEHLILHDAFIISATHATNLQTPTQFAWDNTLFNAIRMKQPLDLEPSSHLEVFALEAITTGNTIALRRIAPGFPTVFSYTFPITEEGRIEPFTTIAVHIPRRIAAISFIKRRSDPFNDLFAFDPSGNLRWFARTETYARPMPMHDWNNDGSLDILALGQPPTGPSTTIRNAESGLILQSSTAFRPSHFFFSLLDPHPAADKQFAIVVDRIKPAHERIGMLSLHSTVLVTYSPTSTASAIDFGYPAYVDIISAPNSIPSLPSELLLSTPTGFAVLAPQSPTLALQTIALYDIAFGINVVNGRCVRAYPHQANILHRPVADQLRTIPGCDELAAFAAARRIIAIRTTANQTALIAATENGHILIFTLDPQPPHNPTILFSYPLYQAVSELAVADLNEDGIVELYALTADGDLHALHFVPRAQYPPVRALKDGWESADIDQQFDTQCLRVSWKAPLTLRPIQHYHLVLRDRAGSIIHPDALIVPHASSINEYRARLCVSGTAPALHHALLPNERYFAEVIVVYADGNASPPEPTDGVIIAASPGLETSTFAAEPNTQATGDPVRWQLILRNSGTVSVTALVQIPLPSTLSVLNLAASTPHPPTLTGGGIAWSPVVLQAGETHTLTLLATSALPGEVQLDALVATLDDIVPEFERSATATFVHADLSYSDKSALITTALTGEPIVFALTLSNTSPITVSARATDTLPGALTWTGMTVLEGDAGLTQSGAQIIMTATLPPFGRARAVLTATAQLPGPYQNCAVIAPGGHQRCASVFVDADSSALQVAKTLTPLILAPNTLATYTLHITNTSNKALSVLARDLAPDGVTFEQGNGWATLHAHMAEWAGTLPPNSGRIFSIVARMPASTTIVLNRFVVTRTGSAQSIAAEHLAFVQAPSPASAIALEKQAVRDQTRITYFLTLRNHATVTQTGLVLRSPLATYASYIPGAHTASEGILTYDPALQTLVWQGALAPHGSTYITWTQALALVSGTTTLHHYHNAWLYHHQTLVAQAPSLHLSHAEASQAAARVLASAVEIPHATPLPGIALSLIDPIMTRITRQDGQAEFIVPFDVNVARPRSLALFALVPPDAPWQPDRDIIVLPNVAPDSEHEAVFRFFRLPPGFGGVRGMAFRDQNFDGMYNAYVDAPLAAHSVHSGAVTVATSLAGTYFISAPAGSTVLVSSPAPADHITTTSNPAAIGVPFPAGVASHDFGFAHCPATQQHCTPPPAGYTWLFGFIYRDADGALNNSEALIAPTDVPVSNRVVTVTVNGHVFVANTNVNGYYALTLPVSALPALVDVMRVSNEDSLLPLPLPVALRERHALRLDIPLVEACPSGAQRVRGFVFADVTPLTEFAYGLDEPLPVATSVVLTHTAGVSVTLTNFAFAFGCVAQPTAAFGATPSGFAPTTPELVNNPGAQPMTLFGKRRDATPVGTPILPALQRLSPLHQAYLPAGSAQLHWQMFIPQGGYVNHLQLCLQGHCSRLNATQSISPLQLIAGQSYTWTLRACLDAACLLRYDSEGGQAWQFHAFAPQQALSLTLRLPPRLRFGQATSVSATGTLSVPAPLRLILRYYGQDLAQGALPVGAAHMVMWQLPAGASVTHTLPFTAPNLITMHPRGYPLRVQAEVGYLDAEDRTQWTGMTVESNVAEVVPYYAWMPIVMRDYVSEQPDAYEPDDTPQSARMLPLNQAQARNLAGVAHRDYVTFTVQRPAQGTAHYFVRFSNIARPLMVVVQCWRGCADSQVHTVRLAQNGYILLLIAHNAQIASQSTWLLEILPDTAYQPPSHYTIELTQVLHAQFGLSQLGFGNGIVIQP